MTMTLDSVPAKLNELDLRAPLEVFEAIEAAIRERADLWSKWQAERCFRAKAEAELAAARETIKRLNRRVQVAEAGIAEKVKASAPGSLGRALANAAADKYMRERDMAQAELAALKARIADAPRVYHSSFEYTLDASTLYARAVGIPGEETYALVKVEE